MNPFATHPEPPSRSAACTLGGTALLATIFMTTHPTGHGTLWGPVVHAILISLFAAQFAGYLGLAGALGPCLTRVRLAVVSLALAVLWLTGAALANLVAGRLREDLGLGGSSVEPIDESVRTAFALCWSANQTLAEAGSVALGASMCCFGLALVGRPGLARALGVLGLVGGTFAALSILSGAMALDVPGMLAIVIAHTVFSVGGAAWMLRSHRSAP